MYRVTVGDVMTRDVVSVSCFTPYKDLVRVLLEHGISAMPVVGEDYRVEGVVSEGDLIEKQARTARGSPEPFDLLIRRGRAAQSKVHGATAQTLMTSPAITIRPEAGLTQAARLMARHAVKRLPVVDGAGELVGIVSRSDLLKPFLRSDEEIHDAVVYGVLVGEMCVDPVSVQVRVRDGVVTLAGELDNGYAVHDTVRLTRSLAGVVDVIDKLRARPDDRGGQSLPPRPPEP